MDSLDRLLVIFDEGSSNALTIRLDKIYDNPCLFSFNEFQKVKLKLLSSKYKVIVECRKYRIKDNYYDSPSNQISLEPKVIYTISDYVNDIFYIPDRYNITISDGINTYDCYFYVNYNRQVSYNGMQLIISRLNDFIDGLAYDHLRLGNNDLTNDNLMPYKILKEQYHRIRITIFNITSNINTLSTIVVKDFIPKKQNIKSIRKEMTKPSQFVYNVKKVVAIDSELVILKGLFYRLLKILNDKYAYISNLYNSKRDRLALLIDRRKALCYDHSHDSINETKYLNSNIDDLKKLVPILNDYNNICIKTIKLITKFYHSDFMSNIELNYNYNFNYSNPNIIYFSNLIHNISSNLNTTLVPSDKQSQDLFELYAFILVKDVLLEKGYRFDSSLLNAFSFHPGSSFIFTKGEYKIEVLYDNYCNKYNKSSIDKVVSINSYNCNPDYIIKYYNNNILTKINIIEIKYRSLYKMIDYPSFNDIDNTINDYYQLAYKDTTSRLQRSIVDSVYIIYPDKEEHYFTKGFGNYVGLNIDCVFSDTILYKILNDIFDD